MFWLILLLIAAMAAITAAAITGCVMVFMVVMFVADPIYLRVKRGRLLRGTDVAFDLAKTGQYTALVEKDDQGANSKVKVLYAALVRRWRSRHK